MASEAARGLDMSLDDLIKTNRSGTSRGGGSGGGFRGRGRGRFSGPSPSRRFVNRAATRPAPYAMAQAPGSAWQHDMYAADQGGRALGIESGTKLYISNLDYGVSNDDIKELFSEVGDLKRYSIHYDRSGRSKGTAEVVYSRRVDALAAVKRYDNVELDGKPMKIEIVANMAAAPLMLPPANNTFRTPNAFPRGGQRWAGASGRSGGGRGFGRGRGRGRGRDRDEKVSAEDLDAELDKYHSEGMQIN